MNEKYSEILGHKRPFSYNHPMMSNASRACQFAPFAALTGFEDVTDETARQTDSKITVSDNTIAILDRKLRIIDSRKNEFPEIKITYYVKDEYKEGGEYITFTGALENVDMLEMKLRLYGDKSIPIDDIINIESEIFCEYDI